MAKIMAEVEPIAKGRQNQSQGYKFRGVDDVYLALQGLMAKYGVLCLPTVLEDRTEDRTTAKGSALIYRILKIRYDFYAADGSNVSCVVIGEGMDSGDKASNKAMSVAHKYCLLQAFMIPTEDPKDPENESQDLKPKNQYQGPERFNGADAQKRKIADAMTKQGITDKNAWSAFAKQFMNQEMNKLEQAIDAWKVSQ